MKKNKWIIKNKTVNNIVFSLLGTIGIVKAYELASTPNLSNNIINILIFIMLFNMYQKNGKYEKKEYIFSYCISIFLSIILIIGTQLEVYGDIIWSIVTFIKITLLVFAIIPICLYLIKSIRKINIKPSKKKISKINVITFGIIFICNFLAFLALYPGVYGYDAGFQILEVLDKNVQLTSHFSVPFCFLLGSCINFGKTVFNSYQIGLAIFSLIQMTFMTFVATKISLFIFKKTKNNVFWILTVLFFSFFPPYTVMSLSTAQDVIFAGLFALVFLNLIELSTNEEYYQKKTNAIKLVLLIFLTCIVRNNALYALLIAIPFILVFKKQQKILTLIILIIPIILFKIYTGPIFKIMKVYNEPSTREMVSIPSQQLARVYNYNYTILNKKELKLYDKYYLDLDNFEYYTINPEIADLIKVELDVPKTKDDFGNYLYFWMKIGKKDPENYVEAFLMNTLGLWYPNKTYNDKRMYHPYLEYNMLDAKRWNKNYVEIKRDSKFPLYEKALKLIIEKNEWKNTPVISNLFIPGFYFLVYICTIGMCIIKKKIYYLIPLSYIAGLYATLFLAPVSLFRYCFPIIILVPIMISMIIEKEKN